MNPYEMTFIIRPDLDEEQTRIAVESVTGRITAQGGELIATYPWNPPRRRLAYPIKDFGDGYYMTTVFSFPAEGLREFERGLRLNTGVLRFLILQATDLNITQGQQRAQQAAARAAGAPPAPAGVAAPQDAPQAGPQAAASEPAVPADPSPDSGSTAPEQAAPAIEQISPSPEPVVESAPEPESVVESAPELEPVVESAPEPQPEPVASAPAAEGQE